MRFIDKSPVSFHVSQKTVTTDALYGLGIDRKKGGAAECIGFDGKEGVLRPGYLAAEIKIGEQTLVLPENCEPAEFWTVAGWNVNILLADKSGKMYICTDGHTFTLSEVTFSRKPEGVYAYENGEVIVLSDTEKTAVFSEGTLTLREDIPPFEKAVFFRERLWILSPSEQNRLRYCAPLSISDFTEEIGKGGYIDFPDRRGRIIALLPEENGIYIVRRFGIQKLACEGDPLKFCLYDEKSVNSEIYANTICEENGILYFLTESGLASFDTKVKMLYPSVFPEGTDFSAATADVCRGEYIFSLKNGKAKDEPGFLGVFRTDGGGGYFLRKNVEGLKTSDIGTGMRVVFVSDGKFCSLVPFSSSDRGVQHRLWKSAPSLPFGGIKCMLTRIWVQGRGMFFVTVKSETGTRRFVMQGDGDCYRQVNLPGNAFTFIFETDGVAEISGFTTLYTSSE